MMSTARTNLRGRLGVLIAGSLVFTALTAGAAAASVPAPMGVTAPEPIRLGAPAGPSVSPQPSSSTHLRTSVPGFLLDRGRYTTFDALQASSETAPASINNHGQIVGAYIEDDADATYHGFLRDAAASSPPSTSLRQGDRGQQDQRPAARSWASAPAT